MKFLHLGDLHLGRSLGDFDLIDDQKYILDQIRQIAKDNQVDAFLIAGDVYDKSIPSEAAVRLLNQFLLKLTEEKFKIFMISGNHDSDERLNFGSLLFEDKDLYISAKYEGTLYKRTFTDAYGPVNVFLMPFVKASHVRRYYPEDSIETYDDAVKVLLAHGEIDPAERNIIVAHQFVTGGANDPERSGSESLAVQNVGLVEKIGCDTFDGFDYAALGHIHGGQSIGREQVRYSGSPLKYSTSEADHEKSVPIITIGEKGHTEIELVPLRPMRDLRHLSGPLNTLIKKENVSGQDDYIYVTLTDEEIDPNAMSIFTQYYPNTVRLEYKNSRTQEVDEVDITQITKGRSFGDLVSDFYEQMYGVPISEEEMQLMNEIAGEAGVDHETN